MYNLAAQSHVQVSFETPEYTANADALGPLRLLEAIRILGLEKTTKFYQASTSELYGLVQECRSARPRRSIRAVHTAWQSCTPDWITVNYREAYNIFASNGVLFNHESPIRGETFVTRKIARAVAAMHLGYQNELFLGNLDSRRDWGHARELMHVEGMWRIMQHSEPDDFVLATGEEQLGARIRRVRLCRGRPADCLAWRGRGRGRCRSCIRRGSGARRPR